MTARQIQQRTDKDHLLSKVRVGLQPTNKQKDSSHLASTITSRYKTITSLPKIDKLLWEINQGSFQSLSPTIQAVGAEEKLGLG